MDDRLKEVYGEFALGKFPQTREMRFFLEDIRCFTPELARVLAGISKGSNTLIIKSINVLPAGAAGTMSSGMTGEGVLPPPMMRMPGEGGVGAYLAGGNPSAAPAPATGKGGLQTVLKEQLLRAVVEIELVKLLPKS